jgi:TolB protein
MKASLATLLAVSVLCACGAPEPKSVELEVPSEPESPARGPRHSIVFTGAAGEASELFALDLSSGTRHQLTSLSMEVGFPVWSPDGDRIAFITMTEESADLMLLDLETDEVSVVVTGYAELADWGPRGERLLIAKEDGLSILDLATGNEERVDTGSDMDAYGRWARDGDVIAFESGRDGNPEIYVTNLMTGETTRLTDNPGLDEWPSPSPDGSHVAWASGSEEDKNLWVMRADGSEKRQVTEGMLFGDAFPEWAPDGTRILLTVNEDDVFVLKLIDLASGEVTHLGEGAAASWR